MAQPPPVPYAPPARPLLWQSPGVIVAVVFGVVIVVGVLLFAVTGLTGGLPVAFFAPLCGVGVFILIIIVVVVVAASQGFGQSQIPPPPPIQQPMVPAGMQGPIALNCPNCGAPPQNVDRFGVATCTYCNTRYLVR